MAENLDEKPNAHNVSEVLQNEDSFYIPLGSEKAFLKYLLKEGKMYILSTYTPAEYRGMGIASRLMDEAVKFATKNNLKIVPVCSYAQHYVSKHPELRKMLEKEDPKHVFLEFYF